MAGQQSGRAGGHGLPACAAVDSAVSAYKQDQDRIAAFLADCTEPAEGSTVQASVLFRTYLNWCSENNEKWRMANKQFGMEVKKHYEIRKGMYYNEYVDMPSRTKECAVWRLAAAPIHLLHQPEAVLSMSRPA